MPPYDPRAADRALLTTPDFEAGADNASAIAEVCVRVDGLPLALKLAAVRIKLLSPADIAARLHEIGCRVVAVSDSKGGIFRPEGLDVPSVQRVKQDSGLLTAAQFQGNVCDIQDYEPVTQDELLAIGVEPGLVRLSVGIESIDDILADLELGFAAAKG